MAKFRLTMIQHHADGSHTVTHHPHAAPSKSGAFSNKGQPTSYKAKHANLLGKLKSHLGLESAATELEEGSDHLKSGGSNESPL